MAKNVLPTPEELRKLLRYEPETGKLFWRERTPDMFKDTPTRSARHSCALWNGRFADKEAFTSDNGEGYLTGAVWSYPLKAHRVIWAIYHGAWPLGEVDHTNHVRDDNRIDNLRDVPKKQNALNQCRHATNTSGHTGVHLRRDAQRWRARITVNGELLNLGSFLRVEDAVAARKAAEVKYGFHHNHGS